MPKEINDLGMHMLTTGSIIAVVGGFPVENSKGWTKLHPFNRITSLGLLAGGSCAIAIGIAIGIAIDVKNYIDAKKFDSSIFNS
jgi:hypothetical protein